MRGVKLGPHVMEAGLELCDFGLQLLRLRSVEQHCKLWPTTNLGYKIWGMARNSGKEEKKRGNVVVEVKKIGNRSADKAVLEIKRRLAESKSGGSEAAESARRILYQQCKSINHCPYTSLLWLPFEPLDSIP